MFGAINMGLEGNTILIKLAQLRQRHDLKATAIGQNGMGPVHELMQAAQFRDALRTGAQHQMISVAEHNISTERAHLIRIHGLDCGRRANRHEGGRANNAARHGERASSRHAITGMNSKREGLCRGHNGLLCQTVMTGGVKQSRASHIGLDCFAMLAMRGKRIMSHQIYNRKNYGTQTAHDLLPGMANFTIL